MLNLETFIKENPKLPTWFSEHKVLGEVKEVKKIFPSIGLDNFRIENNELDDKKEMFHIVQTLCYQIKSNILVARQELITKYKSVQLLKNVLDDFLKTVSGIKMSGPLFTGFLQSGTLRLQQDLFKNKKVWSKAGEKLFKTYNKIIAELDVEHGIHLTPIEKLDYFKVFSSNNITSKTEIVFSANGNQGAWDIVTMSQRGIQSCQGWYGQFKQCLIGSVIDPFTAIIYLTSGTSTEFGSKMIRRCVVRFIVDSFTNQPAIMLEPMYPSEHASTLKAFMSAIKAKVKNGIPVYYHTKRPASCYIPYSNTTSKLVSHTDPRFQPYVNSPNALRRQTLLPYRDTFTRYKLKPIKTFSEVKIVNKLIVYISNYCRLSDPYMQAVLEYVNKWCIITDELAGQHYSQNAVIRSTCIEFFKQNSVFREALVEKIKNCKKKQKNKNISVMLKANKTVIYRSEDKLVKYYIMPIISKFFRKQWLTVINKSKLERLEIPIKPI